MKTSTYMSTVDKYLLKHAKGEIITQKMLQQSCRLSKEQAARYVSYCIRIGLGKKTHDGIGLTAFNYTPAGDQRTRTIGIREDANNLGRKRGVKKPRSYVKRKLEEMAIMPPAPPPKPYNPPQVYAADPVMLEKLDVIASGLAHLSKQLEAFTKLYA